MVRVRRCFRPNDCNQDLNNTAGDPFPESRGPECSLSCAESTIGTDYATESVPPKETAYARHKLLKTERGGTSGTYDRTGAIGAMFTVVTDGPKDVTVMTIDTVVPRIPVDVEGPGGRNRKGGNGGRRPSAFPLPRLGSLLAERDPLILRERDLLQIGIAEQRFPLADALTVQGV